MTAKVTDYWWAMLRETMGFVAPDQREALLTHIRAGIQVEAPDGFWEFLPDNDARPTGYISDTGLESLRNGGKAIIVAKNNGICTTPIYAARKDDGYPPY